MRLFVALELDDEARGRVAEDQARCRRALGAAAGAWRWVRSDRMHLTLAFVGRADEPTAAAIIDAMRGELPATPFEVAFGGWGAFPPRGAPSVLWLGLLEGGQKVAALQMNVAERFERVGIPRESREYHPHLTLARARGAKPADRRALEAAGSGKVVARVAVRRVTLFESRLSPRGPDYTALVRTELNA